MSICGNGISILMRHGDTDYKQGNVPVAIEDAYDLTQQGIEAVTASALEIREILKDTPKITIYTSPMGRTIHTAQIVKEHVATKGRELELVCAIELQEVHNFQWDLFKEAVLASGLDVAKEQTDKWVALNPFRDKTPELLNRLPSHLRTFVENVETEDQSRARFLAFVASKANTPGDKIYVTHDGLLCGLLMDLSGGQIFACPRSRFYEITPADNEIGIAIGRNNIGYTSQW